MTGLALAAAAIALLSGAHCRAPSPTYTVRSTSARAPAAAPPAPASALRVLHFGDFGDDTCQQSAVASGIAGANRRVGFDLAFAVGDNIYECGPDASLPGAAACAFAPDRNTVVPGFAPPADPSFARLHEAPLSALAQGAGVPVYLALGNHDVASCGQRASDPARTGEVKACLEVAHASPLWRMPGRHYVLDRGPARFIVIDSNLVKGDYGGFSFEDEVAFVARSAAACRPAPCAGADCAKPLCFLVGHHPPVTAGEHRADAKPEYLARMDRVLRAGAGRIRAYLAGHDHDLQHLRTPAGLDVFVSGNTSRGRPAERFQRVSVPGTELIFASAHWGHAVLEIGGDGYRYRFESEKDEPLYCCVASETGPCVPVGCRSR